MCVRKAVQRYSRRGQNLVTAPPTNLGVIWFSSISLFKGMKGRWNVSRRKCSFVLVYTQLVPGVAGVHVCPKLAGSCRNSSCPSLRRLRDRVTG